MLSERLFLLAFCLYCGYVFVLNFRRWRRSRDWREFVGRVDIALLVLALLLTLLFIYWDPFHKYLR